MIPTGSRYESAERGFALSHIYNEYGFPILEQGSANLKIRVINRAVTYIMGNVNRIPATHEYYAKDTENIQFLGYKFLGDAKRWWEIADANPNVWYPLDLRAGDYLFMPSQT